MNTHTTEQIVPIRETAQQLLNLIAQCADYYWLEDAEGVCRQLRSHPSFCRDVLGERHANKTLAEAGLEPIDENDNLARYQQARSVRLAFHNITFRLTTSAGTFCFSISGTPIRDSDGDFCGYHCAAIDISERRDTESGLKRFRVAMDMSMDMIYLVDRETLRFIDVNQTACDAVGRPLEEMLQSGPAELLGIPAAELIERYDRLIREGSSSRIEREVELVAGIPSVIEVYSRATIIDGRWTIVGMSRDITERRVGEAQLRESEARFRSLTSLGSDFYWQKDTEFRFTEYEGRVVGEVNRRAIESLKGRHLWDVTGIEPDTVSWERFRETLAREETFRDIEFTFTNSEGHVYHMSLSGEPIFDGKGVFAGYRGISRDISERKRTAERLKYMANHDSQTGLPNRVMFQQILGDVIKRAIRYPEDAFAIMFIDLDRFKSVNDTYGHHTGDTLLQVVADRLRAVLRDSDLVARLGGDEFVILLHHIADQEAARAVADNVLALFSEPLVIDEHDCDITASIGISIFGIDADNEASLMKHADAAMYVAKDEGRNNAQFYADDIHERIREKVSLERHLRGALDRNELLIHYQAVLNTADDSIIGVEALLRWNSPVLGSVSPDRFIPVAEETGMILRIGDWVMRNAARQVVAWQDLGIGPLKLAVNLSARQFNDRALAERVSEVLQETGLPASQLELEITESTMMHNPRRTTSLMSRMRDLGVRFALDDFGTGYSSLDQLKSYPLETLKVDRSFVAELEKSTSDQAICRAIISLGQTLGMQIVAEGVETAEQQAFLRRNGCQFIQGYLFHRPQTAEEFEQFYRAHRG